MVDFTSDFWSWFIGVTTVVSIVGLVIFVRLLTTRRQGPADAPVETMGHVWDENLEEYNNPLPRWWLNLFYLTLIWGLIYLILYPGLGAFKGLWNWSQTGQYEQEIAAARAKYDPLFEQYQQTSIAELVNNEAAIKVGERLFSTYCTTCHGSDAGGARGFPNLTDDDWLYGGKPEQIVASVTNGRSGVMPGWEAIIGADNVAAVADYVEQLAGREVDAASAAKGKGIYNINCIACHGADGNGNQMLGAPRLTDDVWLYGGSRSKIIESIAQGRNGIMPPHGEFLGAAKIHLLGAYVYQLAGPR